MISKTANILIVDDHALFRFGLRLLFARLGTQNRLLEASNAEEGLSLGKATPALDLILLDLHLPGLAGVACVRAFRQAFPDCPLVLLSGSEEKSEIEDGLAAGARDFIHKSSTPEKMLKVIREVMDQGHPAPNSSRQPLLTARQIDVLARLCAGSTNKEIARALGMSENTVRVHLHDIFRVLGVNTRTQAAMLVKERGLV